MMRDPRIIDLIQSGRLEEVVDLLSEVGLKSMIDVRSAIIDLTDELSDNFETELRLWTIALRHPEIRELPLAKRVQYSKRERL